MSTSIINNKVGVGTLSESDLPSTVALDSEVTTAINTHAAITGTGGHLATNSVTTAHLIDNNVTDAKVGNRSATDASVPTNLGPGTITQWLTWFVSNFKRINGSTNWYDAPAITLAATNTHVTNTANPHSVTAAQIGALANTAQITVNTTDGISGGSAVSLNGGSVSLSLASTIPSNRVFTGKATFNGDLEVNSGSTITGITAAKVGAIALGNVQTSDIVADAVTDTTIGNRTAVDNTVPTGLTGTITTWFTWIVSAIKRILGSGVINWYDAPPITLTNAYNHTINTSNPHAVTAAQISAAPLSHTTTYGVGAHIGTGGITNADIAANANIDTSKLNLTNFVSTPTAFVINETWLAADLRGWFGWSPSNTSGGVVEGVFYFSENDLSLTNLNDTSRVGFVRMSTASSGDACRLLGPSISLRSNANVTLYSDIYIQTTNLSNSTDRYTLIFGFNDQGTIAPDDGVYFIYDEATSPNWICKTSNNGNSVSAQNTSVTTSTAVVGNVWIRLEIRITGVSSADFYINGSLVATINTNLPGSTRMTYLQWRQIRSSGTATTRKFFVDNCYMNFAFV